MDGVVSWMREGHETSRQDGRWTAGASFRRLAGARPLMARPIVAFESGQCYDGEAAGAQTKAER